MYSELNLWQREYDVPGQIVLRHELDLGLKRNARILFMENAPESAAISKDSEPCVIIDIDKHIPLGSLCFVALEWHEFCHAEPWLRDHVHTGHDNGFMLRYLRKPFLFLANVFVVPILYPLYRREV